MTVSSERLHWWQYIGPWPLRAWVGFWGVGAVNLIAGFSVQRDELLAHPVTKFPGIVLPVAIGAGAFALFLYAVGRFLPSRTPRHLVSYLLLILCGTFLAAFVTFAVDQAFGVVDSGSGRYLAPQTFRMALWSCFLLAVIGNIVRRLSRQTQIAEEALAVSLEQQSLMLVNEERSRRQIAALLHDRVQAGLMAACLELRMATSSGDTVDRSRIEAIITRLDDMRGMDVRQAARTLSPDLVNVDLRTALQELAQVHEPGMVTSIDIAPAIAATTPPPPADVLLACYRIVEQALLNAVVHGHASSASVRLALSGDGQVAVSVTDNGRGVLDQPAAAGFGTAIIDSWCRVLGGSWSLVNSPAGGAVLTAHLPLVGSTRGASEAWPLR